MSSPTRSYHLPCALSPLLPANHLCRLLRTVRSLPLFLPVVFPAWPVYPNEWCLVWAVLCPSATFDEGHTILVGDALCGPRPHTAAGANQAAFHALSLHSVIEGLGEKGAQGLAKLKDDWEPVVLGYARELYESGQSIGNLCQFGDHPMSVDNLSGSRQEVLPASVKR
jgi:hypothetical protein